MTEPRPTRRDLFRLAGAAMGAGLLAPAAAEARPRAHGPWHLAWRQWPVASPAPRFAVPLTVPPVLAPSSSDATTDYYDVVVRRARQEILPGKLTPIWGYDGQFPGPTIVARRGRRTVVRQVNQLDVPITTHLHGGHTPPSSDGFPTDLVAPGGSRAYAYPNDQQAASLWYHDHRVDHTATAIWMGLAGMYLVHDDVEAALPLPAADYDVPLVIQDRLFNADGSFFYPGWRHDLVHGVLGDTILVNGRPQPYFRVAARKYRFRILNGSNARVYRLALSDGSPVTQVATGGGLLPAPLDHTSFLIGPGERYGVVVDFSRYPVGTSVVLKNLAGSGSTADVMRFDVARQEPDPSSVPATLAPYTPLDPASATATRAFRLSMAGGLWVINGRPWDAGRVDAYPRFGATEIWEFRAHGMGGGMGGGMVHTMHLHLVQFQVLDRNGRPPERYEQGWKDTVFVASGDTVRVIARFDGYRGRYPFHCHVLEHEDHAMMSQFEVV